MMGKTTAESPGNDSGEQPTHQRKGFFNKATAETDQGWNQYDAENNDIDPIESHE